MDLVSVIRAPLFLQAPNPHISIFCSGGWGVWIICVAENISGKNVMNLHSLFFRLDLSPWIYPVGVAFCVTNNHAYHHKDEVVQFWRDNHVSFICDKSLNSSTMIIINMNYFTFTRNSCDFIRTFSKNKLDLCS